MSVGPHFEWLDNLLIHRYTTPVSLEKCHGSAFSSLIVHHLVEDIGNLADGLSMQNGLINRIQCLVWEDDF